MCADQRTTPGSWLTLLNCEIKLRSPCLHSEHLYWLIHLTGPQIVFLKVHLAAPLLGYKVGIILLEHNVDTILLGGQWSQSCLGMRWTWSCEGSGKHSLIRGWDRYGLIV